MRISGKKVRGATAVAALLAFFFAFLVSPVAAATSYQYNWTFGVYEDANSHDLGKSGYNNNGASVSLGLRQTGFGHNGVYEYKIRMALEGIAPGAPSNGPSGLGWNYPDGDNYASPSGKVICFVTFRVIGQVSGGVTTTDGDFQTNPPATQTNNERLKVVSSDQLQEAWSYTSEVVDLASIAMIHICPPWIFVEIAHKLINYLNPATDTGLGYDWWVIIDNVASITFDYRYCQLYYSRTPGPEQVTAVSYFWWKVPQHGAYMITVEAEVGYGHWQFSPAYGFYTMVYDGSVITRNYLGAQHS